MTGQKEGSPECYFKLQILLNGTSKANINALHCIVGLIVLTTFTLESEQKAAPQYCWPQKVSSAEDLTTKPNNGDERGLALPKPLRHLASTICIKLPHPSTPVPAVDLSSMTTLWRGNQVKTGSPQGLLIK